MQRQKIRKLFVAFYAPEGTVTGTGSIVNKNVPEGAKAIGAPIRIIKGERS